MKKTKPKKRIKKKNEKKNKKKQSKKTIKKKKKKKERKKMKKKIGYIKIVNCTELLFCFFLVAIFDTLLLIVSNHHCNPTKLMIKKCTFKIFKLQTPTFKLGRKIIPPSYLVL